MTIKGHFGNGRAQNQMPIGTLFTSRNFQINLGILNHGRFYVCSVITKVRQLFKKQFNKAYLKLLQSKNDYVKTGSIIMFQESCDKNCH